MLITFGTDPKGKQGTRENWGRGGGGGGGGHRVTTVLDSN